MLEERGVLKVQVLFQPSVNITLVSKLEKCPRISLTFATLILGSAAPSQGRYRKTRKETM